MTQTGIAQVRIAFVLSCFAIAGCGGSDGDSNPAPTAAPSAAATELEGSWTSTCRVPGVFGVNNTVELNFNLNDFKRATTSYENANCRDAMIVVEERGTFEIGLTATDDIKQIDFSLASVQIRPLSRIGQLTLESVQYCGFPFWPIGVTRDVTAASGGDNCVPAVPSTEFDIFRRQGNTLFLGLKTGAQDGTTTSRRPSLLETYVPFTR